MAEYQTPEFHPAFEEYCEAIYELHEDDVDVIQARIAERLEISRPAVSEMIRRLEGAEPGRRRRRHPAHRRRQHAGRAGRAPPSPGRALPDRHPRAVVGRRPHRGRQVGARHLRAGRGGHDAAPRRAHHLPPRQPHPGLGLPAPATVALDGLEPGRRLHRHPHPRGAGVHARPARVPGGGRRRPRSVRDGSPPPHPTAPSRVEIDGGRWASAPSPAPASSSPPADRQPPPAPGRQRPTPPRRRTTPRLERRPGARIPQVRQGEVPRPEERVTSSASKSMISRRCPASTSTTSHPHSTTPSAPQPGQRRSAPDRDSRPTDECADPPGDGQHDAAGARRRPGARATTSRAW